MPIYGGPLDKPVQIQDLLRTGLEKKPDELALASSRARWTWRELDEASARYAAGLIDLGLRKGDRVASLMPNRDALVIHYLGCLKARVVMTPLNYRYMAPEIDHALSVSEASVLLAHAERDRDLAASEAVGRLPLGVIRYGADNGRAPSFETLLETSPGSRDLPSASLADPVVIFFTSGSTGKPKGVTHSYETLGWMMASAGQAYGDTADDVVLPGSSMSHVGGYGHCLKGLAAGGLVIVARQFDAPEMLMLLREYRPTVVEMLPSGLINLVRDHGATQEDFSSVRLFHAGGDRVSAELEREFSDLTGFSIAEGHGMTEVGLCAFNRSARADKVGSIGPVAPGIAVSIRDEDGNELPVGAEGRFWVKSPGAMVGYWNRPDATAEAFVDGWLDTGDVLRVDEDGYFWFCGRRKQIIVHDGSNISPAEVEESLLEHPAVADAGVVGVRDFFHGEIVRAFVTLKDGVEPPTGQELIDFSRARVGYKAPEVIEVLDNLPLNPTGKLDRAALKRLAAEYAAAEVIWS